MKKFKKVFAVILSLAMVLGMSVTTFAKPAPTSMPKNTVTVKNVAAGCEVWAYQIVSYDLKGEWIRVEDGKPTTLEQPDETEILAIAANIASTDNKYGSGTKLSYDETNEAYTAELNAGMWIVLVKGSENVHTIYNPMIVSVNVDEEGNGVVGTVGADGHFNEDDTLYAKSSTPTVTKTVKDPAYELNDNIEFEVVTTIPSYSSSYQEVEYIITDTLSPELVNNKDVVVMIEGETTPYVNATTPVAYTENDTKMIINIDSETVLAHPGMNVTVTYSAKLTDTAKTNLKYNVNPTTNSVKLEYSNDPYNASNKTEQNDDTHHYTFGIDASVLGQSGEVHKNFIKTGPGKVDEVTGEVDLSDAEPLAGAEFELVKRVKNEDGTDQTDEEGNFIYENITGINNVKSDEEGLTKFVGLDANVTYYLHEVAAPAGYTLVEKYVPVFIKAEFDEDNGALKDGWTITIGETVTTGDKTVDETKLTGTYSWGTLDGNVVINGGDPTNPENPYKFPNTKLASLPSTGGIGTTIFTIGGCAIMIIAAALFFASRRKSAK